MRRATKNRTKIEFKTRSKKTLSENRISSGFGVDFWRFWGTKVPPYILGNDSEKNIENQVHKQPVREPPGNGFFESGGPPIVSTCKYLQASYEKHKASWFNTPGADKQRGGFLEAPNLENHAPV